MEKDESVEETLLPEPLSEDDRCKQIREQRSSIGPRPMRALYGPGGRLVPKN